MGVLEKYFPRADTGGRRQLVLLEYVLLKGVNDSLEDAARWAMLWV